MSDRITLVEQLLEHYPRKAKELLVDYCQNEHVRSQILQHLGGHYHGNINNATREPPSRLNTTFESHRPIQSRPQQLDSPDQLRAVPRQGFPGGALEFPASPPGSASVASHSSLPEAAGRKQIWLLPCDDDDKELPVWSRSAPVKQSLVADTVVHGRAQSSIQVLPEDHVVYVPIMPGNQVPVNVKLMARLTWRLRREYKTRINTFYVVPAKLLDTDILFGSEDFDNAECAAGRVFEDPLNLQPIHMGGISADKPIRNMPQPTPSAPIRHFDQAGLFEHGIVLSDAQPQYAHVEAIRARHRMHDVAEEGAAWPHHSPANNDPNPHRAPAEPDHHRSTVPPAVSLHNPAQGSGDGHIRVAGNWDKMPISLSLDLDAKGEVFYQDFLHFVLRRKRSLERHRTTMWLNNTKEMSLEEAYELRLSEEELEEGWDAAVEWIQENKRTRGPHIYVTVEVDTG